MKSIILIHGKNLSIEKIQSIKYDKFIDTNKTETSLAIELENGRLYLDYNEDISLDYDNEELEDLEIKNPKFIAVEYSSIDALKILLKELEQFNDLLVDDDKGNILDVKSYLNTL